MKKVLFIVGSLRAQSFNRQLAEKAASSFAEVEYSFLDYRAADILWIFTPEYNGSYPGVLKNLLDWISRPANPLDRKSQSVITGKSVMIGSVAGKSGGLNAQRELASLLRNIGALLVSESGFNHALNKEEFETNKLDLSAEERMTLAMEVNHLILSMSGF